jgi:hypothetical protein
MYDRDFHFVRWRCMSDDQVDDWASGTASPPRPNSEPSTPYTTRRSLDDLMSPTARNLADSSPLAVDPQLSRLTATSLGPLGPLGPLGEVGEVDTMGAFAAVTAASTAHVSTPAEAGRLGAGPIGTPMSGGAVNESTNAPTASGAKAPSTWRRRLIGAVIVLQALTIIMLLATMKLFVYPKIDEPRKVDAIVVLGGLGERIERGVQLYQAGYGGELWISVPQWANGEYPYVYECTQRMTNFGEHCFDPRPKTTQGEARSIAQLAAEHGWKSVMVVTTPDQTTRARMVIKRCYSGDVVMLDAPNRAGRFFKLAYEWGATIKALTIKRGC